MSNLKLKIAANPRSVKNNGYAEAGRMRALAECLGLELRTFLEHAVRAASEEAEKELRMKAWVVGQMTREQRQAICGRRRKFLHSFDCHHLAAMN
jgi:hypothetical protein